MATPKRRVINLSLIRELYMENFNFYEAAVTTKIDYFSNNIFFVKQTEIRQISLSES